MPQLSANLSMLFTEVGFLDRFDAASRAGFRGVEYLFPYDFAVAALKRRLEEHGLVQVLHNLPAGDWAAGERGIACLPDRVAEFRDGVGRAVEYASALGCRQVNCLAGVVPQGTRVEDARETFVANLAWAAPVLQRAGIALLVEAINTRDIPGFFLSSTAQAVAILDEVGAENLRLQYDIYHMQIMEGDVSLTIEGNLERIGHIQLADNPGRHEPGTGEINYPYLLGHLDRIGYDGWVGCEYVPLKTTVEGLGWARPYIGEEA